jgi:hypothetical protein
MAHSLKKLHLAVAFQRQKLDSFIHARKNHFGHFLKTVKTPKRQGIAQYQIAGPFIIFSVT